MFFTDKLFAGKGVGWLTTRNCVHFYFSIGEDVGLVN
jgi:hypothetical protein